MNKNKVFRFSKAEGQVTWGVSLNGENLEEVKSFIYLGVDITVNGTTSESKGE